MVRTRDHAVLKTNFINIIGAIDMMKGLDYHHANFMNTVNQLIETGWPRKIKLQASLLHEATAYLNRLGQFYYFVLSTFVQKRCPNAELLIPTIKSFVPFRMKYSAHRSIDAPKNESEMVQAAQAMSMSSIGGQLFQPKPGHVADISRIKTEADYDDYVKSNWKHCYYVFQLITDDRNVYHNFSIEKEHPAIIDEAFAVLKEILK